MLQLLDNGTPSRRLLVEHNVTVFGYERRDDFAIVRFVMNDQRLRLIVKMPDWEDPAYRLTPAQHQIRSVEQRRKLYWADVRRTWAGMRALIAAKLEGIALGITTFEEEFRQFEDATALLSAGEP